MSTQKQEQEILTTDLRKTLKAMFQKELESLPETLSKLEPEKRLNMLIKLMPFVMPKIHTVSPAYGEPDKWSL